MTPAKENTANTDALLIVGNPAVFHIGAHFRRAAEDISVPVHLCDTRLALDAPWPVVQWNWRVLGHRPPRLNSFSRQVLSECQTLRPAWLLATGMAPLTADTLRRLRELNVTCLNYLTDDPWNPAHRAGWFLDALPNYDQVYSPRRANLDDLRKLGCRQVDYLPFAYAPHIHYPESAAPEESARYQCDVLFYGGADQDRIPYIVALLEAGLAVHLYGGYWERHARTRPHFKGHADPTTLRKAVAGAKITLCLVRRANRDGHVMRTFEAPAMGGCMLTEDTPEHRALLGPDGDAVVYFDDPEDLMVKTNWLLANPEERSRLAQTAHVHITQGAHRYTDRLRMMLPASDERAPRSMAVAVNALLDDPARARQTGANAASAFDQEFRYDRQLAPVLTAMTGLTSGGRP